MTTRDRSAASVIGRVKEQSSRLGWITMKVMRFTNIGIAGLLATALGVAACQQQEAYVPDKDSVEITADHDGTTLAGYLAKPEGDGPFPAVVLMHGCGGLEKNTSHRTVWRGISSHAALLNDNGYVTLILDSSSPRRMKSCGDFNRSMQFFPLLVKDSDPRVRLSRVAAVRRRGTHRLCRILAWRRRCPARRERPQTKLTKPKSRARLFG